MNYKCPTCGKDIEYGVNFCPHCGAGIEWNTNNNDDTENKWICIITACIPVFLMIIGQLALDWFPSQNWSQIVCSGIGALMLIAAIFRINDDYSKIMGVKIAKYIIYISSAFALPYCIGVFNRCSSETISETNDTTEISKALSYNDDSNFLSIDSKATYEIAFEGEFADEFDVKKATFTLYKDGTGTCEFSPNDNMPPFRQCKWSKSVIENPMSKGGDGKPIKAISVAWHDLVFTIDVRKKIHWMLDSRGELYCIGSVKRIN